MPHDHSQKPPMLAISSHCRGGGGGTFSHFSKLEKDATCTLYVSISKTFYPPQSGFEAVNIHTNTPRVRFNHKHVHTINTIVSTCNMAHTHLYVSPFVAAV